MVDKDGKEHRCKEEASELKQETISNLEDIEKHPLEAKEDATLDNVILRENLLLDQIEDGVKNHLEKKYPLNNISGDRIGMRVKEIYKKINR